MEMHRLTPRLSVSGALRLTLAMASPVLRQERIPLGAALGRVTAQRLVSPIAIPPFPSSHVDGYALRSRDLAVASAKSPLTLVKVGEVHAGEIFPRVVRRGETVAVATGAAVPRGADAVEMFEEVEAEHSTVRFGARVPRGENVDGPGRDLRRGEMIIGKGEVVTPALVGALGICGRADLQVYERPRVAILSNGDELTGPGRPLAPGHVYESNSAVLAAVVERSGGRAVRIPPVPDDEDLLEAALRKALRGSDLVVVSGGSSVGERDFLGRVFPRLGKLLFHGVRVRPGMPTLAARVGRKPLLGMPGHPASCLSNALWLLTPVVRKMASLPGDGTERVTVTLDQPVRLHGHGFTTVVPLRIAGGRARSTFHGSHFMTSLRGANGFAILPPSKEELKKGERLQVHQLAIPAGA